MLLGIIVFSLLLLLFVIVGTLLLCGKGYFIISGYKKLNEEEKKEFISKNNLSKVFKLYAYYCYGVSVVLLIALIGALLNSMVTISVSYMIFAAGTIATLIVVNVHSNFKVVSLDEMNKVVSKNTAELEPKRTEIKEPLKLEKEETEAKPTKAKKRTSKKKTETKMVEEKKEEKPVEEVEKPKTTTKKSTAKKTTAKKTTTKKTTSTKKVEK